MALTKIEGGVIANNTISGASLSVPATSSSNNYFLAGDKTWLQLGLSGAPSNTQTFTSSGTWTKPASGGYALVRLWGAGGSGGKGTGNAPCGGGGGGAFVEKLFDLSELSATETVTIGLGGASQTTGSTVGNEGGNSFFGLSGTLGSNRVAAYGGGGGGFNTSGGRGGGGGGGGASGVNGGTAASVTAPTASDLGSKTIYSYWSVTSPLVTANVSPPISTQRYIGVSGGVTQFSGPGGAGGTGSGVVCGPGPLGKYSYYGGGGGGGGQDGAGTGAESAGGGSNWGGGGGGGASNSGTAGTGGVSAYGGNGGAGAIDTNTGTAGTQPGGGGGGTEGGDSGKGGDGQCIVYVF